MIRLLRQKIWSIFFVSSLLIASYTPALADDDLFTHDWSVGAAYPLDKYAPSKEELEKLVNRTLDTDWNMSVCNYKFVNVYDKMFRLVASLDVNGRHQCNRLVVIAKTGPSFTAVNKMQVLNADYLGDMLTDLDNDQSPEMIVTQTWTRPEHGHCTATWKRIFKWRSGRFVDESSSYRSYYKDRLRQLETDLHHGVDPVCTQMEIDKINRQLGTPPTAGYNQAVLWMKSPDASLRRKAAAVFADINDSASKKNLALLAKDDDPLTAESARLYVDGPNPTKE